MRHDHPAPPPCAKMRRAMLSSCRGARWRSAFPSCRGEPSSIETFAGRVRSTLPAPFRFHLRWNLSTTAHAAVPRSRGARPLHHRSRGGSPFSRSETPPPPLTRRSPSPFRGGLRKKSFPKPPRKGEGDQSPKDFGGGVPRSGRGGPKSKGLCWRGLALRESGRMQGGGPRAPSLQKEENIRWFSAATMKESATRAPRGMRAAALRASARRGGGGYTHRSAPRKTSSNFRAISSRSSAYAIAHIAAAKAASEGMSRAVTTRPPQASVMRLPAR